MTDDSSFRRLGRKNRKSEIKSSGALFPEDSAEALTSPTPANAKEPVTRPSFPSTEPPTPEQLLPDLSSLGTQEDDLALLASLPEGLVARPLKIAPSEQRFPPMGTPRTTHHDTQATTPGAATLAPQPASRSFLYNLITAFAVLGTIFLCAVYSLIWQDPQTLANPFPPRLIYVQVTATPLPATADSFSSAPVVQPTNAAPYPFGLAQETVLYIPNANGRACEWASIAGTVTARDGSALNGYRVRISGDGLDETVFSGATLTFGAGGYEFPLGGAPVTKSYSVQLFSPQGAPLSAIIPVTTLAVCEQNVALVNFREN